MHALRRARVGAEAIVKRALLLIALALVGCMDATCKDERGAVVFEGKRCSEKAAGAVRCSVRCENEPGGRVCTQGRTSFNFIPAPGVTCTLEQQR